MTGPTPAPLPLATTTTCPRCAETVTVVLSALACETEPRAIELVPTYTAMHRCPDLEPASDPWAGHVPAPRTPSDRL